MRVQIAFTLGLSGYGDFFELDHATEGKLDNTTYVLGGSLLVDVTDQTRELSISRGRSMTLERTVTGLANIILDNRDRRFDPSNQAGPYYGTVFPRKEVRIDVDSENLFVGVVEDWNFDWMINGDAVAEARCVDGLALTSTANYPAGTSVSELSSARVERILDAIGWPADTRSIATGAATLDADIRTEPVNARDYLAKVALSEAGFEFVNRNGDFTFLARNYDQTAGTSNVDIGDSAGRIPMIDVDLVYGTEELLNSVTATWSSGGSVGGTASHAHPISIGKYGELTASYDTLLASASDADDFAEWRVNHLSEPRLRFDAVSINVDSIGTANQADLLGLDLGDIVHIQFTPSGVGSAIDQYSVIDRIAHDADPSRHDLHLVLSQIEPSMVLNSSTLGVLNQDTIGF